MVKRLLLVAICTALVFAASGCGGGGTSYAGKKPDAWAADLCGTFTEWALGMQVDSQVLRNGGSDLKSRKEKFVAFIKKAVGRSDTLLSKVKAAGPPAVKNGGTFEGDLQSAVKGVRDSFANVIPDANALPTTNRPTFSRKVRDLSKDPAKKLATMGQTFSDLRKRDESLNKAMSKDTGCQKLLKGRA